MTSHVLNVPGKAGQIPAGKIGSSDRGPEFDDLRDAASEDSVSINRDGSKHNYTGLS